MRFERYPLDFSKNFLYYCGLDPFGTGLSLPFTFLFHVLNHNRLTSSASSRRRGTGMDKITADAAILNKDYVMAPGRLPASIKKFGVTAQVISRMGIDLDANMVILGLLTLGLDDLTEQQIVLPPTTEAISSIASRTQVRRSSWRGHPVFSVSPG